MLKSSARTDLASEAGARLDTLPDGVISDTLTLCGCSVSSVIISTPEAAEALGKPMGKYLTLEMVNYVSRREPDFSSCAGALREILLSFPAVEKGRSFLIACLGNRAVTPDAVGPCAAAGLCCVFLGVCSAHGRSRHDGHRKRAGNKKRVLGRRAGLRHRN